MIFAVANNGEGIMNKNIRLFTIISTLILITGIGQIAFGQNARVLAEAQRITGDKFTVSNKTPKGANVYAVNKPSSAVLNAIDKGLTDLFAVARKNGYRNRLNYSDYSVYIGKADRLKDSAGQY